MKNSRQKRNGRTSVRVLGPRVLAQIHGGDGSPLPAAQRQIPDGMPLPGARLDDGTPFPA
jgi:hypothetical protein